MVGSNKSAARAGAASAIALAVAVAAPVAMHFEGLRTRPYRDPAGIPTVCYGETRQPMRAYTPEECATLLRARQARDYGPRVLQCAPGLAANNRVNAFAASIDFAYNAGQGAFCRSPMARDFNAGRWPQGCSAFLLYDKAHVNGRLTVLKGLQRRRMAEASLCTKGP